MNGTGSFLIPINAESGVDTITVTVVNNCGQSWNGTVEIGKFS